MRHTAIQGTAERTDRTHPRIFVAIMLEIQINKRKKKDETGGDLRLVVISRPQQPIVKINVQFVLNGSPPHLADSLSCCNLAIELSRNLVTDDYLAACNVCLSVCLREGAAARKIK